MRTLGVVACFLLIDPAIAHEGDGKFVDRGATTAHNRFQLDLGPIDLERAGTREFRFSALPKAEYTFGLRLRPALGEQLRHVPNATVRMTLVNEKNQVVFTIEENLTEWVRSESHNEWFLYSRGPQEALPGPGGSTTLKKVGVGPDGGWGTYVVPRSEAVYRLTVETVKPDSRLTKFDIRLLAVGGGWK